ncbi:hypothetical protein BS50DRAFT_657936 [Corynespora cassiicola Philippines]|uniref:Uncharacterized protein n=1 Tax=Corynespora cassiicola Philippines TaxID=1448308 RepID=A0A2T2P3B1_CORCC|nr:hypothetical protein BS50DRAFT_657936 [Corynespora cassiicola Philippines]
MPRQTPGVQLQYRSYLHPMSIYHVSIAIMPLKELFYHLKNSEIGFLRTMIGEDPPSSPAEGDETPFGSIEVIYMPLVLAKGGSSLGFRITDGKKKTIEWLCFGGPVQDRIEGMEKDGHRVFDFVAKLEKSDSPKRGVVSGHKEHRDLFESLEYGELRLFNLKLTWRNKVQELQAAMEKSGRTARARVQDQMETVRTEVGNMVVSVPKGAQYIQSTRGAIPLEATDR